MGHALMMYYEPFPHSAEPREWDESIFGDVPWCESFNKLVPQKPNAGALVKTFVLEVDLPEKAEEDCLYPGDRMRFTSSVLSEVSLDDHPLSVLAIEEKGLSIRVYPREFTDIAKRAESFAKTIVEFRTRGKSVNSRIVSVTSPAKRVLVQDLVDGNIYSVSPKLLRRDG